MKEKSMIEVEVKILGIDAKRLESKILALGGIKTFEGMLTGNQYDFEENHPNNLHNHDMSLRLRKEGIKKVEVTLKKFRQEEGVKISEEFPVEVDDFQTMHVIFENLGLHLKRTLSKKRVSYDVPDLKVHLDIDTLKGCPTYLEIEAHTSEEVKSAVEALGYTMAETTTWNQYQVMEFYHSIK